MLQLTCPYCGLCDETEFSYHGQAGLHRPHGEASPQAFFDYVYLRDNPCGAHRELWQHRSGCRSYIQVLRNTQTHEVLACGLPDEDLTP